MKRKVNFEWDEIKDKQNCKKHSVSFYEAQYAFSDQNRVILHDIIHSKDEERYYCIGKINNGILTVRFTYRNEIIRIYGAGYWRKGKKIYEEKNKLHR